MANGGLTVRLGGDAPLRQRAAAPAAQLERTRGLGRLGFKVAERATVLARLHQQGAARILLPRVHGGGPSEAVLINTAGGLTGGDALDWEIELEAATAATVTTQACEKVYRALGSEPARVETVLRVGPGASLAWLPQETILFDGGNLQRCLTVELADDARLLALEAVIFGRRAMGETVRRAQLRDHWTVRRAGRLVFADRLRFAGPVAQLLARPAVADGGGAVATIALFAEEAERYLTPLRDVLPETAGASAWDGKLLARIVAEDGYALRQALVPALGILSDGRPLPRIWAL
ncbi:MAG: urease accessory protein UreD [Kiloniellales bacterium]